MTELETVYLWPVDWRKFQHYKDRSNVRWVKNYTRLLRDDAYLELSLRRRGILHGVWLAFAASGCKLPIGTRETLLEPSSSDARAEHERTASAPRAFNLQTRSLHRALGERITRDDVEALYHAGFIELLSSTTLAERLQAASALLDTKAYTETEIEIESPTPYGQTAEGRGSESEAEAVSRRNGSRADRKRAAFRASLVELVKRGGYPNVEDLEAELTDRGCTIAEAREIIGEARA